MSSLSRAPGELWSTAAFATVMTLVSRNHTVYNEWGGVMQAFAGREILAGAGYRGWCSHFWPPMFSILIGIGGHLMPAFTAGKAIAVLSGTALVHVTYHLALLLTGDRRTALLSQVFTAMTPLFFFEAMVAHNHMLDALLFNLTLLAFVRAARTPSARKYLLVGALAGLAALTRLTSNVLVLLAVFGIWGMTRKQALKTGLGFGAGFAAVSTTWWLYNTATNGSPWSSWTYLNVGQALSHQEWRRWWWKDQAAYDGVWQLVAASPKRYLLNVRHNLQGVPGLLLGPTGIMAPFAIAGALDSIISPRTSRMWITLLALLLVECIGAAQAFVPPYALLSWSPILSILGVSAAAQLITGCQEQLAGTAKRRFGIIIWSVLLGWGVIALAFGARNWRQKEENYGTLADVPAVTRALQDHDPELANKCVMAVNPARAYYAGSRYLATPLYFEGAVEDLVRYRGLSAKVKEYAPKYPSDMSPSEMEADYLVYTRTDANAPGWVYWDPPQFSFLLDPSSPEIPSWFHLIYASPRVVVYEIAAAVRGTVPR